MDRMKRENYDHGFPESAWEAAKAEARSSMIAAASRQGFVTYSGLVAQIESLELAPQSTQLGHLLGEISTAEHDAGRGMLTVVVVHKHGDHMPGPGFFRLARSLGYEVQDRETLWLEQLEKVHRTWCGADESPLPPKPLVPNAETIAAMQEARAGKLVRFDDVQALLEDLHEGD
ncbi:MAG: hypothetical protein OXI55_13195 [Gammaproteobacteria bacterium]|nr:hypothetical protein [Gammaproteobacteria bacterium]